MSFENPTRLRLGMSGNFGGKDYRVVGRSVLGENESGETFYWNEFNLEAGSGGQATLVFDETEPASQWRLFTQFDPEYPMPASDAAAKRVGDQLNLTGEEVRVTFRGASRVYYIEGQAPEGEEVSTEAEYFNAEADSVMQVVSWTGDEVEYYNGVNLSRRMVASAFGLPQELGGAGGGTVSAFSGSNGGGYTSVIKFAVMAAVVLLAFLVIFGRGFSCSRDYAAAPVKKVGASAPPLAVGATGTLFDKLYRVTAHALVEIDEVGAKWDRHEYELSDDYGSRCLLVCGDRPETGDWLFLEPLFPVQAPTAPEAAAKKVGDLVELDGFTGKVTGLFRSTLEQTDGSELDLLKPGTLSYGLCGTNESRTLLARWNAQGIQFFRGRTLPAKKAADSFTAAK
jgi:hypothetical protein